MTFDSNVTSIKVVNGKTWINGEEVKNEEGKGIFFDQVIINGNVEGDINTMGKVVVKGDVRGSINTMGSVTANDVGGKISTMGNVTVNGTRQLI